MSEQCNCGCHKGIPSWVASDGFCCDCTRTKEAILAQRNDYKQAYAILTKQVETLKLQLSGKTQTWNNDPELVAKVETLRGALEEINAQCNQTGLAFGDVIDFVKFRSYEALAATNGKS